MLIAFLIYPRMTALDAVGPHEVLSRIPGVRIARAGLRAGGTVSDSGLILHADTTLSEVPHADVLVVPGAVNIDAALDARTLAWIRQIHESSTWTTSVCSGSLILGASGILEGHAATTHWARLDQLEQFGATARAERVVESGKILSAAGVSAGIDLALALTARIASRRIAEVIQLAIEYDPQPPFDTGSPQKAGPALVAAALAGLQAAEAQAQAK